MPQPRRSTRDRQQIAGSRRPPRSASRRKRERRREAELRRATTTQRGRRVWIAGGAGATVVVVAVVLAVVLTRSHSGARPAPAPTAVPSALASLTNAGGGKAVGSITCDTTPSTSNLIRAHLAIYVNGQARAVPAGIGVGPPRQTYTSDAGPLVSGACYYWLNTRTQDGLIVVQPPQQGTFTLGQFFDVWGQPLSASQAGPASGAVTVLVNGSRYSGDPRAVQLTKHAVIQVDVGTTVPYKSYSFQAGQ